MKVCIKCGNEYQQNSGAQKRCDSCRTLTCEFCGKLDREWRTAIFQRDKYTCRRCKVKGGSLQAHHVKPYKDYPALRYVLSNGLTLCVPCHKRTKTYGWQKYHKNRNKIATKRLSQEVFQF